MEYDVFKPCIDVQLIADREYTMLQAISDEANALPVTLLSSVNL